MLLPGLFLYISQQFDIIDITLNLTKCPLNQRMYNESLFVVKTESAAFAIVSSEVMHVELTQIGKFIAELRKEHRFTQEQLGDKIGVTNKTISRWETGVYLPPADALLMMSELFDVSINEILSGKKLSNAEYREAAEENLRQTIHASSFSLKEKVDYFKKKWLKEHIAIMVLWGICIVGVFITGIILSKPLLVSGSVLLLALGHGWRNNTMMTYIEQNAFDGSGRQ